MEGSFVLLGKIVSEIYIGEGASDRRRVLSHSEEGYGHEESILLQKAPDTVPVGVLREEDDAH